MSKIARGTKNAVIVPVTNSIQVNSGNTTTTTSVSYADYNQLIRDAQPVYTPEPSNVHQQPPRQNLQYVQEQPQQTAGPNFCPKCGQGSKGMKFCQGCGNKLF
jgi:hypothetical protein